MDIADQYIDRVADLPPAPTVATELLGLFGGPNHDIDRIVELIGHDPSLTVDVLDNNVRVRTIYCICI